MPQFTQGGVNPAAQGVPDLFVQVNPPPAAVLPGAPSNIIGVVGTATWGPVGAPVVFGDLAGCANAFGYMQARKYDLATQVQTAAFQGANAFAGVRVTDGTDVAALVVILVNCLTLTAKYTGSRGNSLTATIAAGTANATSKITLSMPGMQPETFDNIAGAANTLWVNMAAAINNGQNNFRGASQLVTASAGAGVTAPALTTYTFASGTDGATTITSTVLIGVDTVPRTGMYALRSTGLALLILADADTSTSWPTQNAFAKQELCEPIACSPAGDTIANFGTVLNTAGVDDPWIKVLLGDWPYFADGVNNVVRIVSPQGFIAGAKAVAGPHKSVLNRPLYGIVGTQKTLANQTYSNAELQLLASFRGDVITAPSVGGAYFSSRFGRNASSDPGRHQDAWTTMTNYLARSLGLSLGPFVGRLITPDEMREAASAIGGFLENEKQAGRIAAYSVQVNAANNPFSATQIGIQKATVTVTYFSVLEYFNIDLTAGQTVTPASAIPLAA
jgi:hypothetical protein